METGDNSELVPNRQRAYDLALEMGFEVLASRMPSDDRLRELGAVKQGDSIRVPVLNGSLVVDVGAKDVFVEGAGRARRTWAVLIVHYLCAEDVSPDEREVAFAHFVESRGYLNVFEQRIVGRFLATTGRTAERFAESAEQLHAERLPGSGPRYRFSVLPRVPIVIARFEGDAELSPGASVIYRADIECLLPAEDRVVVTELLLDSLSGKSIEESSGGVR